MRMLVCGSRDWTNYERLKYHLDRVARVLHVTVVIEGGARGADTLGRRWAVERGIPVETYRADWNGLGKDAGSTRNKLMLNQGKPDLVAAFPLPGSKGTWHMVTIAREAGVKVLVLPGDLPKVDALGEGVFT